MSDAKASSARRVGFTAMALVVFWVASFGARSIASQLPVDLYVWFGAEGANAVMGSFLWGYRALVCGLLFALLPFSLLSLASHNSPIKMRDYHILVGGVLFATCIGFCFWAGEKDSRDVYATDDRAPWPWLLLPIILTTAFVIYGAWRAVRDAEVGTVGEDEDE